MNFAVILAACPGGGIGDKGTLPWRLKGDMAYFKKVTSEAPIGKTNVVIMGRKTWESIPKKFRPLENRLNIVLSKSMIITEDEKAFQENERMFLFRSLEEALKYLESRIKDGKIGEIFVIGGASLYEESLKSSFCKTLYFTKIFKQFMCDTVVDEALLPPSGFEWTHSSERKEQDGIQYEFQTYVRLEKKQVVEEK